MPYKCDPVVTCHNCNEKGHTVLFCEGVLQELPQNKNIDKNKYLSWMKKIDDQLYNTIKNNNLCYCLFIIVSAESLIDPKKI